LGHGPELGLGIRVSPDEKRPCRDLRGGNRGRSEVGRNDAGLGLGLYITREIAKAHGGAVAARSAGDETVFTVTLPRIAPEPTRRTEPDPVRSS
jgi:signal transduction histidine kinase